VRASMRYCLRCDNTRWVCENHLDRPFLGGRAAAAGAPVHLARTATQSDRPRLRSRNAGQLHSRTYERRPGATALALPDHTRPGGHPSSAAFRAYRASASAGSSHLDKGRQLLRLEYREPKKFGVTRL
jgi:hypothetical protein